MRPVVYDLVQSSRETTFYGYAGKKTYKHTHNSFISLNAMQKTIRTNTIHYRILECVEQKTEIVVFLQFFLLESLDYCIISILCSYVFILHFSFMLSMIIWRAILLDIPMCASRCICHADRGYIIEFELSIQSSKIQI